MCVMVILPFVIDIDTDTHENRIKRTGKQQGQENHFCIYIHASASADQLNKQKAVPFPIFLNRVQTKGFHGLLEHN